MTGFCPIQSIVARRAISRSAPIPAVREIDAMTIILWVAEPPYMRVMGETRRFRFR
jgi:hypothetical protein